jgi:glycosyltransferase involved in cell wall biosynthesis
VTQLTIVLPVFNEEGNLPRIETDLIPVLESSGRSWEILVVDDGSRDQSPALLRDLAHREPRLRIQTHETNFGLGRALRTGFAAAQGDFVLTLDTDFTFHPQIALDLLAKQEETQADCVIGSPLLRGGALVDVPFHRTVLTKVSNRIYRLLLRTNITSITAICRLYRREALAGLNLRSDGFQINAEVLAGLVRNGRTIVEIPASLSTRTAGVSKIRTGAEIRRHLALIWLLLRS